jgi:hypothetical protein
MGRLLAPVALAWLAGCTVGQPPSAFNPEGADAATDAGHGDGGTVVPDGGLLGDGGGPTTFPCGATFCPSTTYCLITLSDGGAELQEDCYPPECDAGDCACISGVVASAYCQGGHVACTDTPGVIVTCAP